MDLQPVLVQFDKLKRYINQFIDDAKDPKYIAALAGVRYEEGKTIQNLTTRDGDDLVFYLENSQFLKKCPENNVDAQAHGNYFECKMKFQYKQVFKELRDIREIFVHIYERFRAQIDQLEFRYRNGGATKEKKGKENSKKGKDGGTKRNPREVDSIPPILEHVNNYQVYTQLPLHEKRYIIQLLLILQHINQRASKQESQKIHEAVEQILRRDKRFDLLSIFLGWTAWSTKRDVERMKENIHVLRRNQELTREQIQVLAKTLNQTITVLNQHTQSLVEISYQLYAFNRTLKELIIGVEGLRVSVSILNDLRNGVSQIKTGIVMMENNIKQIEDNLRIMATRKANPIVLPPEKLRSLLEQIKEQMRENPRLQLPEDPEENIWAYYQFMTVSPIVLDKCLVIIITIPLIDTSLEVELYKAYTLPALHPELRVQFQYKLENSYLGIANHGLFALLPSESELELCKATNGYYCYFRQALYPTEGNQWCIYALFTKNRTAIEEYCQIDMNPRYQNLAINLEGFWWAVSAFHSEHIHVRCLTESYAHTVQPPLEIMYIPNGCEGFSPTVYIPARSEMTLTTSLENYTTYFHKFEHEYTRMDTYHVWFYLEVTSVHDLTPEEKQEIAEKFTTIPPMNMKLFKKTYERLQKSNFSISSTVILVVMIITTLVIIAVIVIVLWLFFRNKRLNRDVAQSGIRQMRSIFMKGRRTPANVEIELKSGPRVKPGHPNDSERKKICKPSAASNAPPPLPLRPNHTMEGTPSHLQGRVLKNKPITPSIIQKATQKLAAEGYTVKA